jgi:hypothetical protein
VFPLLANLTVKDGEHIGPKQAQAATNKVRRRKKKLLHPGQILVARDGQFFVASENRQPSLLVCDQTCQISAVTPFEAAGTVRRKQAARFTGKR